MTVVQMDHSAATGRWSDGELPHGSTRVWAIAIFGGRKAHHWIALADRYISECGRALAPLTIFNGQNSLLGAGTYPKCKLCMDSLRRKGLHSARSAIERSEIGEAT